MSTKAGSKKDKDQTGAEKEKTTGASQAPAAAEAGSGAASEPAKAADRAAKAAAKAGSASEPSAKTIRRETNKTLQVKLTDEDKLKLGDQMARALSMFNDAEERRKAMTAQLKAESEQHRAEAARLGVVLSNGYEYRDIRCEVERDMEKGRMKVTRLDTGEVIEDRALRGDERQGELAV